MTRSSQNITSDIHLPPLSNLSPTTQTISPIPAFYLYRTNGIAVPLIALDELPPWLRIGREDWYSPEWQQYMSPVSEQSTIRVGEYEVFAMWGEAMYQLPIWRLVGARRGGHGDETEAGTEWEVEGEGRVVYHSDREEGYGYRLNEGMRDDGSVDGGGGVGDNGIAAGSQDGEQVTEEGVNREGVTQNVPNTPASSPARLDNNTYDGGDYEGFSYFDLPLSRNDHNHHCPHQPRYQQHSSPRQQATMSSIPPAWPPELSRSTSNNSYNSAGRNYLHSLASNTNTETSMSSFSSSDIPHAVFHVPILPRVPLGSTQSAPSCFPWGMHHGQFTPWLVNTVGGDGSVHSV
ncbi:hypothetical protein GX50_05960 [[Emmonsia] crescens]|uniref:Uncharacterized protein n=1 Tax=[Emmonsia] crescens TaxID=73230 RepID=A0A2B7ZD34_9EURO|nr:hypothetical protein GX50_05960 [Emmonsia crescens]